MSADFRTLSPLLLSGLFAMLAAFPPATLRAQEMAAETVATLCRGCHRDKFEELRTTPHAPLDSEPWRQQQDLAVGCIACHGDATAHIRAGGGRGSVFAFGAAPAVEQRARCVACHDATHPSFDQSPHAAAGLSCTDCHRQHGAGPDVGPMLRVAAAAGVLSRLRPETRICIDCHGEIFTQFAASERHRLTDGILQCVSCHDPHDRQPRALLGGFKQDVCEQCHADKTGPFVYEHPASRVESCTVCHTPHGSPNRHLLAHQQVAELCLSCHATVPQFHLGFSPVGPSRFSTATQCTNCHSAIHGSNFSDRFLR